jgi:UDP-glucuronate 4-epimerase
MRIVVTGCAGFVGSHLCETLLAEGHDVVGIDAFTDFYPRPLKEANLASALAHPGFRFFELDLRSDDLARCLEGAEVVVHEAAMPGLPRSWSDFQSCIDCNLLATQRLLAACVGLELRTFLQISTSSVYGLRAIGDETRPPDPVSPYGITKLAAEHLARAYARKYGIPAAILRYFSIYGPRQRPDMAYRIFIDAIASGRPVTVDGDGRQSRSITYVSDAVRGTIQAIDGARPAEVYNIGGGIPITVNDALDCIGETMGVTPEIVHGPPRPGDQRHTLADTSKARAAFGYKPTVAPLDGLRRQIAWQLEAGPRLGLG